MQWNAGLTRLRDLLAYLYPTVALSKQAVDQVGMPTGQIGFTSAATSNWHNILREAQRRKRVKDVVDVARKDFPEQAEELAQAEQEYRHWLEQPEPPEDEIPDTETPTGAAKYNIQMPGATGVMIGNGATVVQHLGGPGQAPTPAVLPSAASIPAAVVRDLLLAAFTAEDFRRLFLYTSNEKLRPLVQRLSARAGLADMVDETIEYCLTRALFPDLLAEVKEANSRQHANFARRLQGQSAEVAPASGIPVSEQRDMLEQELDQHRRNLNRLRAKKAVYAAGEEPLSLLNQIDAEEREIQRVQGELADLSQPASVDRSLG